MKSLKNLQKFFIILLINTLFFCILAYILPIGFEENDDVVMCMISSGVYSGFPDAHLVFINYLYGVILTFFYEIFQEIEWYTLSFCIINIISLSIIVFKFLNANKPLLIKMVFLLLLYAIEMRIILLFQFTTTAAIGALAGTILLFAEKRMNKYAGTFLFLIAVLIRFDAAMLVLLLLLPLFVYQVMVNKRHIFKTLFPVVVCICGAFLLQAVDKMQYKNDEEWAYYKEYNAIRGKINSNPNAMKIYNHLPNGISQNDYSMLINFFPDGQTINLAKIKELRYLMQKIPISQKMKNIYPALKKYKIELELLLALFLLCMIAEIKSRKIYYLLFFYIFFIGVLSFIALDGYIKKRVFISVLFPVFFFLYDILPAFTNKKKIIGYLFFGVIMFFFLFVIYNTHVIRKGQNGKAKFVAMKQHPVMNEALNRNVYVVAFAADLAIESYCSPFKVGKTFNEHKLYISGWMTNIPLNKEHVYSYMSFVDSDTYIFSSLYYQKQFSGAIQKAILEHYNCETYLFELFSNENYLLYQLRRK